MKHVSCRSFIHLSALFLFHPLVPALSYAKPVILLIYQVVFFRSSRSEMFFNIGVIKNVANFTGKQFFLQIFKNNF